jgi:hypothetical protein
MNDSQNSLARAFVWFLAMFGGITAVAVATITLFALLLSALL